MSFTHGEEEVEYLMGRLSGQYALRVIKGGKGRIILLPGLPIPDDLKEKEVTHQVVQWTTSFKTIPHPPPRNQIGAHLFLWAGSHVPTPRHV